MAKYTGYCSQVVASRPNEYDIEEFEISEEEAELLLEGKLPDARFLEIQSTILSQIGFEWGVKRIEESNDYSPSKAEEV